MVDGKEKKEEEEEVCPVSANGEIEQGILDFMTAHLLLEAPHQLLWRAPLS